MLFFMLYIIIQVNKLTAYFAIDYSH